MSHSRGGSWSSWHFCIPYCTRSRDGYNVPSPGQTSPIMALSSVYQYITGHLRGRDERGHDLCRWILRRPAPVVILSKRPLIDISRLADLSQEILWSAPLALVESYPRAVDHPWRDRCHCLFVFEPFIQPIYGLLRY
jgi:hypothetical protein